MAIKSKDTNFISKYLNTMMCYFNLIAKYQNFNMVIILHYNYLIKNFSIAFLQLKLKSAMFKYFIITIQQSFRFIIQKEFKIMFNYLTVFKLCYLKFVKFLEDL